DVQRRQARPSDHRVKISRRVEAMSAGGLDHQKPHSSGAESFFGEESENSSGPPAPDQRTLAMIAHLLAIPLHWIAPLVLYLIKKDEPGSKFVADQAKESLNFQLTMLIVYVISALSMLVLVGFILRPLASIY